MIFSEKARAEIEAILDLWPQAAETLLNAASENRVVSWVYYHLGDVNAKPYGCILGLTAVAVKMNPDHADFAAMRDEVADKLDWAIEDQRRCFLNCEWDLDHDGSNQELISIISDWQESRAEARFKERLSEG